MKLRWRYYWNVYHTDPSSWCMSLCSVSRVPCRQSDLSKIMRWTDALAGRLAAVSRSAKSTINLDYWIYHSRLQGNNEVIPGYFGEKTALLKARNTSGGLGNLSWTLWGRATHICVSNLTIFGSDNGLSPGRRHAIFWNNAGISSIRSLGTNFSEILIGSHIFSLSKMHLKMSSAKWCPFCVGLNVLINNVMVQAS